VGMPYVSNRAAFLCCLHHALALFYPETSILSQKRHPFTGKLASLLRHSNHRRISLMWPNLLAPMLVPLNSYGLKPVSSAYLLMIRWTAASASAVAAPRMHTEPDASAEDVSAPANNRTMLAAVTRISDFVPHVACIGCSIDEQNCQVQ